MWEKDESGPEMEHAEGKERGAEMLKMMWDKLDDDAKKTLATRMVDEHILKKELKIKLLEHKKELKIKLLEHKIETLKITKKIIEEM